MPATARLHGIICGRGHPSVERGAAVRQCRRQIQCQLLPAPALACRTICGGRPRPHLVQQPPSDLLQHRNALGQRRRSPCSLALRQATQSRIRFLQLSRRGWRRSRGSDSTLHGQQQGPGTLMSKTGRCGSRKGAGASGDSDALGRACDYATTPYLQRIPTMAARVERLAENREERNAAEPSWRPWRCSRMPTCAGRMRARRNPRINGW